MVNGALALLITGGTENWAPLRWRERFLRVCPDRAVALVPDDPIDPPLVEYAAVWKPAPGAIKLAFQSRGDLQSRRGRRRSGRRPHPAGCAARSHRVNDLTWRMTEYVVMHVLMLHRQQAFTPRSAKSLGAEAAMGRGRLRVGVLGLGVLGLDAVTPLHALGSMLPDGAGRRKSIPGVECFAGEGNCDFLGRTDVLVCLLPLTPETRGISIAGPFQARARRQARRPGHHQCGARRIAGRGGDYGRAR